MKASIYEFGENTVQFISPSILSHNMFGLCQVMAYVPSPLRIMETKKKSKNEKEPGRQCGVKSWLYNFDGT